MAIRIFPMLAGALFAPPVPMGAMISMMSQSADGNELLLMSLKSGLEIISEWFGHEKVRMHFVKLMTENLQCPDEKGTGIGALAMIAFVASTIARWRQGIILRVAGSWVAAIAILVLALRWVA